MNPEYSILFVGSTRGEFRRSVRVVHSAGLPLIVIGSGWGRFISSSMVLNSYIPPRDLCSVYQNCRVLLNDHWEDMCRNGFISNRVFDAVASGAKIVTEDMEGVTEIFGDSICTYKSDEEMLRVIHSLIDEEGHFLKREIIDRVRYEHSFDRRAQEILKVVQDYHDY